MIVESHVQILDEDFNEDPVSTMSEIFNFTGLAPFEVNRKLSAGVNGANLGSERNYNNVVMEPDVKDLLEKIFLPHVVRLNELIKYHTVNPRVMFDE